MSEVCGKFVWYDVMTTDAKAAETFYRNVIGWGMKDSGMSDRSYTILSAGPAPMGGLMKLPDEVLARGGRPAWMGYIGVDNVDTYESGVTAAGGTIHRAAEDIPGVGRFAVAADPHGAMFILFHSNDPSPATVAPGTAGHVGWHELQAGDLEGAFGFYSKLFGWTKAEAIDMGPMGVYQTFATGGAAVGGMMKKMPDVTRPFWLYYFNVDGIDKAVERVTKAGGTVLRPPHQVPGGSWISQCFDPQSALFAMVSAKR